MKLNTISFDPLSISHILTGDITATVRLWPILQLASDETVAFVDSYQKKPFAIAKVSLIETKRYSEFTDEDKNATQYFHEFEDFKNIMESFYGVKVTPETEFRVIHFRLIDDGQDRAIAAQQQAMRNEHEDPPKAKKKTKQ